MGRAHSTRALVGDHVAYFLYRQDQHPSMETTLSLHIGSLRGSSPDNNLP